MSLHKNKSVFNHSNSNSDIWYAEKLEQIEDNSQQLDFTTAALKIIRPGTLHRFSLANDALLTMLASHTGLTSHTGLASHTGAQGIATPFSVLIHILCHYLRQNVNQRGLIAWIGAEVHPMPHALYHGSTNNTLPNLLERSIFITTRNKTEQSTIFQQALQTRGLVAAIAGFSNLNCALARRFMLSTKQNQTLGILVTPPSCQQQRLATNSDWLVSHIPQTQNPAHQEKLLTPQTTFDIQLQRVKGSLGSVRNWQVQYSYEHKLSFNTLSTLVDRAPTGERRYASQ